MNHKKIQATAVLLFLSMGIIFAVRPFFGPKDIKSDKRIASRSMGKEGAPVWVVEYTDFQCGACKGVYGTVKDYLHKYGEKIFLQVRFFPISSHTHGVRSAVYAECAANQDKFWAFQDRLFEKQSEWSPLEKSEAEKQFAEFGRLAGLDLSRLKACVDDPETEKRILKEKQDAKALGVKSTPTFFVNGEIAPDFRQFVEKMNPHFPEERKNG